MGCQLVCDARGLLLSAETHWAGGLRDTDVLKRSTLHKQLQELEDGWLLGELWFFSIHCTTLSLKKGP